MAFSFIQSFTQISGSTITGQYNITPTGGNLIVIGVRIETAGFDITLNSITGAGTWVIVGPTTGNQLRDYLVYCLVAPSILSPITLNFSNSGFAWIAGAAEFSGGPFGFDTSSGGINDGSADAVGLDPDLTPAASGELIVCFAASKTVDKTWTGPSGFTEFSGTEANKLRGAYKLSGTTTEACDWTCTGGSGDALTQMAAAFKNVTYPSIQF